MKLPSIILLQLFCFTLLPATEPHVGPRHGTLLVVGGGDKTHIWPIFLDLAGGRDARIVVITTANKKTGDDNTDVSDLRKLGATHLTILHTDQRSEAELKSFAAPLKAAQAVWITGGRQWKLVDSYLHTPVQREIEALLERGGLVGGSSAGASIQASYLVRGAREGNKILMAPGYEEGFGWLRDAAVDQHVNTRGRENDLDKILQIHPKLLGIGLDESTAILVRGDRAEIVGAGEVRFRQRDGAKNTTTELKANAAFDLAARRAVIAASSAPPAH